MELPCKACSPTQERLNKSKWGVATGLFLAILPKCPFCMVAYTSTAMLCGEGVVLESTRTHTSYLTIIFSAVLVLITLLSIAFNRRGRRTIYAFSLALLGSGLLFISVLWTGGLLLYYGGVLLVFGGVWLNGSFYWVWRQWREMMPGWARQAVKR